MTGFSSCPPCVGVDVTGARERGSHGGDLLVGFLHGNADQVLDTTSM